MIDNYYLKETRKLFINISVFLGKMFQERQSKSSKLRLETKETNVSPKNLLVKSSGNNFIFLPVFNLIICVMKASNNFGKIAILKIWELISLGVVKTHFGKLALKWCIFRHEKINILTDIMSLLLIQLGFRKTMHLKMTVWISALWKIFM